ncbi:prokaryotic membrane lipolipid attachment site family protein [Neisseria sp. Dent CA1/247]|uniref:Prokaryotic membrane lipolipid attachment site family protein n=2 Tax=Neisseria zoodegmatis TaxID=326523 RepID=A0ABX3WI15_9NEIS|nr:MULTISPECIES: prokaryotic membrane lipolipid attachment site family protein [Neisseria]MDO5068611.1 prokaryotic membrane lipolipid attachment site family protein [Neisseria zoodegmatis]OSI10670.1 prokaryotic membrane lipolipid attachment site family protein [Neisseria zoodegmatis]UOO77831.1 prokaryotic membrane lipolipid attachment site family protein [Neisseria sp. Dent CA1/247]
MRAMKKHIPFLVTLVALAGCETIYLPTLKEVPVRPTNVKTEPAKPTARAPYRLAENHWTDVSKIRDEATRLSYQVSEGKITKVQAAQYLNKFRIQQVGRNSIDDSMYEVYLRSAVDSQRGAITTEQSKLYIQNALRGWHQRWPNMRNKPSNPAFTNFLMEVMSMRPLQ